jgi:hypothetical protein
MITVFIHYHEMITLNIHQEAASVCFIGLVFHVIEAQIRNILFKQGLSISMNL